MPLGDTFGSATSTSLEWTSPYIHLRLRTCCPRCADDCHTLPFLVDIVKCGNVYGTVCVGMRPRWKSNQQSSILPPTYLIGPLRSVRKQARISQSPCLNGEFLFFAMSIHSAMLYWQGCRLGACIHHSFLLSDAAAVAC